MDIRLDIEGNSVVSAVATMPGTNHHSYPVYPLWEPDLNLGLHPKGDAPEEITHTTEDDFDDLGMSLPDDEDEVAQDSRSPDRPQRWFRIDGNTLTGYGRIHFAWDKQNKRVHQFELSATLTDDASAEGRYVLVKPSDGKKPKPQKQPEAAVLTVNSTESSQTQPLSSRWTTQFGNDGSGYTGDATPLVGAGSEAQLVWVSGNTVPHSRGPNTRGNSRPQEPGMPLSGGCPARWSITTWCS